MIRIIALFIIWMIAVSFSIAHAQEKTKASDDFESRLLSMKNPFKSQLPRDKEEEKAAAEAIKRALSARKNQPEKIETEQKEDEPAIELADPLPQIEEVEEIIPLPDVTVSGIIWNSDRPQAIINEQIFNIGDTILGIKITEIRKTGVNGLFHGRTVTIKTQRSQL